MTDPCSQLRSATRRAKSDVANKLISMCLHELSRRISHSWRVKVDSEDYERFVRERFANKCPYCSCDLASTIAVIEHLDGMNRYRAGLHVPGNVLVACRRCNSEKRRDDSRKTLPDGLLGGVFISRWDGLPSDLPNMQVLASRLARCSPTNRSAGCKFGRNTLFPPLFSRT